MANASVTRNSRLRQRFIRYLPTGEFVDSHDGAHSKKTRSRREREPRFVVHKGMAYIRHRGRTTYDVQTRTTTLTMGADGGAWWRNVLRSYHNDILRTEGGGKCIPWNDTRLTEQCNDAGVSFLVPVLPVAVTLPVRESIERTVDMTWERRRQYYGDIIAISFLSTRFCVAKSFDTPTRQLIY